MKVNTAFNANVQTCQMGGCANGKNKMKSETFSMATDASMQAFGFASAEDAAGNNHFRRLDLR